MRVRCVRLVNARNEPVESSRSLHVGGEYVVLEISVIADQRVKVRVRSDDGTYSLWPIDIFEVTTGALPSNWVAAVEGGSLRLCPESWSRWSFWEDYFNDDPYAVSQFKAELDRIMEEN